MKEDKKAHKNNKSEPGLHTPLLSDDPDKVKSPKKAHKRFLTFNREVKSNDNGPLLLEKASANIKELFAIIKDYDHQNSQESLRRFKELLQATPAEEVNKPYLDN